MLRMNTVVTASTSTSVLPQVVAQSTLLDLSALELEERVKEELEENPSLELSAETLPPPEYVPVMRTRNLPTRYENTGSYDTWANLADGYTLKQELKQQFRVHNPPGNHRVAEFLIEALNDDGYLTLSVGEVAEYLGVDWQTVEEGLAAVQELRPYGLGARDLSECLRLQLRALDRGQIPEGVEAIIDNMAHLGGGLSLVELKSLTNLSGPQIQRSLDFIRQRLCPYPGRAFRAPWSSAAEERQYAYPDVVLSIRTPDDEIVISIPQSQRLGMRLNSAYERLDEELRINSIRARDERLKQARDQVRRARQFIDNITRRYRTMHKVMSAIVGYQTEFILQGPSHLRPLSKKQIASAVGFHEATVCRATKDKYVLMPDGHLEEIDVFFDDALPTKSMIRRMVNSEDKSAPLSDRRLQEELLNHGFEIARRTVTKYRMQLDIPPASQRVA